jgi:hypothetical protein
LQWFRNLKRTGRKRILRRAPELKFKVKRPVGRTRTRWLSVVLGAIEK